MRHPQNGYFPQFRCNTRKCEALSEGEIEDNWVNFSRFLSDVLLMIFRKDKMSMDFIMGKKPVAQH